MEVHCISTAVRLGLNLKRLRRQDLIWMNLKKMMTLLIIT